MDDPIQIPIRFVGPQGQELCLGEYVAVRKDVLESLTAILGIAREFVREYEPFATGKMASHDASIKAGQQLFASCRAFKAHLQRLQEVSSPAVLTAVESMPQ